MSLKSLWRVPGPKIFVQSRLKIDTYPPFTLGAGQVPFKLPSSDGVTTVGDSGMMAAVRQWMNRLSF